jgi:hypothetical protein
MNRSKPRTGQVFQKDTYWKAIEAMRPEGERLPEDIRAWCFDFISVHGPIVSKSGIDAWSLCSPMCLVNEKTGARPSFEGVNLPSKATALEYAARLAYMRGLHVVIC